MKRAIRVQDLRGGPEADAELSAERRLRGKCIDQLEITGVFGRSSRQVGEEPATLIVGVHGCVDRLCAEHSVPPMRSRTGFQT